MNLSRIFALGALLLAVGAGPARAADGVPARPKPFTFVTDQANLLQPADEKRLENGLRRYADNTGTQVVVLTVPSLGGQDVNAYARQVGTSWGVGEKGKNNGVVVLVASQDHKLSIEPGSGLRDALTPTVIRQVIGEMTPDFKQNNYAGGLRQGLNTLMAKANPSSAPKATAGTEAAGNSAMSNTSQDNSAAPTTSQAMSSQADPGSSAAEAPSSGGIGFLPILIGIAVIGGGIWLVSKLFRRNSNGASGNGPSGNSPNFYPNQQASQPNQPNFYPNQGPGGNYGGPAQSSGSGIGGMLATGAAAAAGAYLGNRMAEGHDTGGDSRNFSNEGLGNAGAGAGAAAGGTAAADDYFSSRNGGDSSTSSPDYFSDNSSSDSNDYFSGNDNSYDDSSGGGGFDDTNSDNSGSW